MNFINNALNLAKYHVRRLWDNSLFFSLMRGENGWLEHTTDAQKLSLVLQNPAALFIICLQCDLASLGKFYVKQGDEYIDKDPVLKYLNSPNPFQSGKQFLWDYMFWNMIGNVILYVDNDQIERMPKSYFLSPDKVKWPEIIKDSKGQIILSDSLINKIHNATVRYETKESTDFTFPYKKLIQFYDLTNGVGNWFKSPSRLDAVYKIVSNSDNALSSKNINTLFSSKFIVSGKASIENTGQMMMGTEEKDDIRNKVKGRENIFPLRSMVDIKRFIEDAKILSELDKSFLGDYYLTGKAYGIPRDVLEAYVSSTYENQEKARASHISYTIQPKVNDFCNGLEKHFGYTESGKEIIIDYSHLPFMQVFEEEKSKARRNNAEALLKLIDAGAEPQEAADYLEIEVNMTKPRNENRGQAKTAKRSKESGDSEGETREIKKVV